MGLDQRQTKALILPEPNKVIRQHRAVGFDRRQTKALIIPEPNKVIRQHRAVGFDRRQTKALIIPEPNKVIRNLRNRSLRHRMPLVRTPMPISEPLRLVVGYLRLPPRLPKSSSHATREAGGSRETPESLHT